MITINSHVECAEIAFEKNMYSPNPGDDGVEYFVLTFRDREDYTFLFMDKDKALEIAQSINDYFQGEADNGEVGSCI